MACQGKQRLVRVRLHAQFQSRNVALRFGILLACDQPPVKRNEVAIRSFCVLSKQAKSHCENVRVNEPLFVRSFSDEE
jgi:hypothetical protein